MSVVVEELLAPIAPDLADFEKRLQAAVADDFGPMADAMQHIVRAGGKRLRPALVLLSCRLGDPDIDDAHRLAMGIEFIHTATLVHDDLIDNSATRRGITTLHEQLGAPPAIIIGDYYFAKGANLIAAIGEPRIDAAISNTVMTICLGELLQMTSHREYAQSTADYYRKIERKTATLLSTCTYAGGIVAGMEGERLEALQEYGHLLGMAFQIADDVLDYVATQDELGKPVGNDLRQGTITLPLMLALENRSLERKLRPLLDAEDFDAVVTIVRDSDAVSRAEEVAYDFADRARAKLDLFSDSPSRRTLQRVCDYVVERRA